MVEQVAIAGAPRVDQDTLETLKRYRDALNDALKRIKILEETTVKK